MKHLFIDMDGTILPIVGYQGRITIADWNIKNLFNRHEPMYNNIEAIEQMFPQTEYEYHILTAVPTIEAIQEKEEWLNKYLPIKNRHYVVYQEQKKGDYIKSYCENNNIDPSNCTLVDDELHNLISVEEHGITAIHISYVLSEREKYGKQKCKRRNKKTI